MAHGDSRSLSERCEQPVDLPSHAELEEPEEPESGSVSEGNGATGNGADFVLEEEKVDLTPRAACGLKSKC